MQKPKNSVNQGTILLLFVLPSLCLILLHEGSSLFPVISALRWLHTNRTVSNSTAASLGNATIQFSMENTSPFQQSKILVVYSGPTSMDRTQAGKNKQELYHRNMVYFMKHGVDCRHQDTVIVVTREVLPHYSKEIQAMNMEDCLPYNHSVQLLIREPDCFDLETLRTVVFNSTINLMSYDFFVYVNCGMSGPFRHDNHERGPWTDPLLSLLSNKVRMSGLTMNCPRHPNRQHVQSFVYAVDNVGLQIILNARAIFDCRQLQIKSNVQRYAQIIQLYEIGMSQAIFKAGYGIASLLPLTVLLPENRTMCTIFDMWSRGGLEERFGHVLTSNETLFFKSSRFLPKELAKLIEYPGDPHWEKSK